jgi:lipooligosaccharide transport system ATP-binding protein
VFGFLGPNGAGKTTLLRIILGLLAPQAGKISIDGKPQKSYSRQQMSRLIGLVPQGRDIFPSLSVVENLTMQPADSRNRLPGHSNEFIVYSPF